VPHSAHVNWTVTFAIGSASLGAAPDAAGHESLPNRLKVGDGWLRVPETAADVDERTGRMDRLKALGRGTQLMFIASVLLLIISFFNWQEVDFDLGPLGTGSAGVSMWDDLGGIIIGILTIVLIARIAARMAAVDVPIPLSFATTSFVLGVLIAVLAVVKNLTDDYSTWASYVGVVLAILVAVGAWLEVQDAGGVEHLKSEASSLGGSGGGGGAPAAPVAAAPAAPAAPAAETPAPAAAAENAAPGRASEGAPETPEAASDARSDEPSNEQQA
jgi:hypothetical protein